MKTFFGVFAVLVILVGTMTGAYVFYKHIEIGLLGRGLFCCVLIGGIAGLVLREAKIILRV